MPGLEAADGPEGAVVHGAEGEGEIGLAFESCVEDSGLESLGTAHLSESDSTRRAMDEFRQATDPLALWLDRHTILRLDAVIPQDRLYREYCRNCSDAGRPTISKTAFGGAMKKLRPTVADYQRTVGGVLAWCYVGIGLVAKEEE